MWEIDAVKPLINQENDIFACYTLYFYYTPCISKSTLFAIYLLYDKVSSGMRFIDYLKGMWEINTVKTVKPVIK